MFSTHTHFRFHPLHSFISFNLCSLPCLHVHYLLPPSALPTSFLRIPSICGLQFFSFFSIIIHVWLAFAHLSLFICLATAIHVFYLVVFVMHLQLLSLSHFPLFVFSSRLAPSLCVTYTEKNVKYLWQKIIIFNSYIEKLTFDSVIPKLLINKLQVA